MSEESQQHDKEAMDYWRELKDVKMINEDTHCKEGEQ